MGSNRELWSSIAHGMAEDPSRAARDADYLATLLEEASATGEARFPPGYQYAGAHTFHAIADDLAVQPLDNPDLPITSTGSRPIPIKIPFDCLIQGVGGWAFPIFNGAGNESQFNVLAAEQSLSSAIDNRDLFSTAFLLDGDPHFVGNGEESLLAPASTVIGSRNSPRPMAWTLRRGQILSVLFRNIWNVPVPALTVFPYPKLRAVVEFHALNVGPP